MVRVKDSLARGARFPESNFHHSFRDAPYIVVRFLRLFLHTASFGKVCCEAHEDKLEAITLRTK